MRGRTWGVAAAAALMAFVMFAPGVATRHSLAAGGQSAPGYLAPVYADPANKFTKVEAPPRMGPATSVPAATATIVVTYHGFTAGAQAAFQAAVDQWATKISSPVTITIDATWTPLGPGILGQAGPSTLYSNFTNAPQANTWYPIALANAYAGSDLAPGSPDITAQFSSSFSWYLGTDGNTPGGQYDLESVVMHELGHGFGMVGFFSYSGGNGSWGASGFPAIFDKAIVNGSNTLLTSYTSPSSALGTQLTGNNVFYNGANAVAANGGAKPKLYAPGTWSGGSSIYHLDESTYPAGNANSLMTPMLGSAEAIHDTGPIVNGILKDMGWTTGSGGGGGGGATATKLAFSGQPSGGTVGSALSPLTVQVQDSTSTVVTSDNSTQVTVAKLSGPGNLTCAPVTASAGVANFTNCSVDAAGAYQLRATSSPALTAANSASFTISATLTPPAASTYDRAAALSTTSLQLFWTDNATNEDGYLVYRASPGPSTQIGGNLPPNSTTVTDTGLSPNTLYNYLVYSWNSAGPSYPGTWLAARTPGNAPTAPRPLAAWGLDTSSVEITWADTSTNETGFRVQRWTGSGFTLAGTVAPNTTSFIDTGLAAGTSYYYMVDAYNAEGSTRSLGGISGPTLASPHVDGPGPAAPTYNGALSTGTTIQLNWSNNDPNPGGWTLVYRGSTQIAVLGPGATSYTDTGLTPGQQYYYMVFAGNSLGANYPGIYMAATTTPTRPVAPATQSLAAPSSTSLKLTWADRSNNEDGFHVYRWTGSSNVLVGTVGPNVTSFTETGLTPGTSYVYNVAAFNSGGDSWAPAGIWAPTMP